MTDRSKKEYRAWERRMTAAEVRLDVVLKRLRRGGYDRQILADLEKAIKAFLAIEKERPE
jgi:hypothetical protein